MPLAPACTDEPFEEPIIPEEALDELTLRAPVEMYSLLSKVQITYGSRGPLGLLVVVRRPRASSIRIVNLPLGAPTLIFRDGVCTPDAGSIGEPVEVVPRGVGGGVSFSAAVSACSLSLSTNVKEDHED